MEIAQIIAKQSYAKKRKVGSVLVKDDSIISFGFNGTPSGFENECEDTIQIGYPDRPIYELHTKPYVLHAESNAITKCAKHGRATLGSTLYVTCSPCMECSKLIIQAGIKRVVYLEEHDTDGLEILKRANIELFHADKLFINE